MFRRNGNQCVATFAIDEVRVLRKVAGEVVGLLMDGFDHTDPVVGRLFPRNPKAGPPRQHIEIRHGHVTTRTSIGDK